MRRLVALLAAVFAAGCLPPVNADTVDAAWRACEAQGAGEQRIAQCTTVIDFPGTAPERRAAALIARGRIRAEQAQFGRAMSDFGRALRINNRNAQAYVARALLHQMNGAYDVAVRDYDQALAIDPSLQAAIEGRSQALAERLADFEEQIAELTERLEAAPTDAGLLNNRCWLRVINDDNLDAALADCNAAVLSEPRSANILDSRGLVHLKRGEYAEAIADYEAALAIEADRGHYLFGRGVARMRLGMTAEGQADIAEAERLQPGVTALYRSYRVEV